MYRYVLYSPSTRVVTTYFCCIFSVTSLDRILREAIRNTFGNESYEDFHNELKKLSVYLF